MFRVIAFAPNGAIFDAEFASQYQADVAEEWLLDHGYMVAA